MGLDARGSRMEGAVMGEGRRCQRVCQEGRAAATGGAGQYDTKARLVELPPELQQG